MAYYGNQTPQFYQPQYQPPQPQYPAQQSDINWVQGEAAAKAYPVMSGHSALLMDSEDLVLYIKSVDVTGIPRPLRIFDLTERIQNENGNKPKQDYVSREEFEELKALIKNKPQNFNKKPREEQQ